MGLVLLARRFERLDVGLFPLVVGGKSDEIEVVVTRGRYGAPLRLCPFLTIQTTLISTRREIARWATHALPVARGAGLDASKAGRFERSSI